MTNQADATSCPHVTDPVLADWYDDHPELLCGQCYEDGVPLPARAVAKISRQGA